MFIIRIAALALLMLAATAVSLELADFMRYRTWHPLAMQKFWYLLHAGSLDGAHFFVQRQLHPSLWDPLIASILRLPAWLVAGLPGLILLSLNSESLKKPRRFLQRPRSHIVKRYGT